MSLYKGTNLISGHQLLYSSTGSNTDGAMTQKATSDLVTYSNVSKVGGVIDSNHVLSGFSSTNYASVRTFNPSSDPWEIVIKVKTGTIASSSQAILGAVGLTNNADPVLIYVDGDNYFAAVIYYASDGVTNTIVSNVTAQSDTEYLVKFEYTGSAYNLYIDDVLSGTLTSSTAIYSIGVVALGVQSGSNGAITLPWLGEIDLKETYINVNGSRLWTGVRTATDVDALTQWPELRYRMDGQWIYSAYTIASGVTYPTSDYTNYSLSSYLPKDGYKYEVLIRGSVTTGTTSGNSCTLYLQSDILTGYGLSVCGTRTRTASSVLAYGTVLLPVGTQRKVAVVPSSGAVGTYALLAMGYRRIGTNI